jgi:hypothetical protein
VLDKTHGNLKAVQKPQRTLGSMPGVAKKIGKTSSVIAKRTTTSPMILWTMKRAWPTR